MDLALIVDRYLSEAETLANTQPGPGLPYR